MAPAGQGAVWSEVLCCPLCSHIPFTVSYGRLPVNVALMSILGIDVRRNPHPNLDVDQRFYCIERTLVEMAYYLRRAESERGGSVWSEDLSRPIQRKLLSLLCYQLVEDEGRQRALRTAKGLAERILTEILIAHQNNTHLSSSLWSAVRARGCQFLGPAMQEEVLRLILLTLSDGDLIARKTLVMYIVQTLCEDYPQVSKTCVGHVVQLLYRASCFNVIKREGESSLMQLKNEFRDYDTLRREHDSQIVQIAMEAGLRVSPDQWSALLYGDQAHRSHMQSIIDKLQSSEAFDQMINELRTVLQRDSDSSFLLPLVPRFERFSQFDVNSKEALCWQVAMELFDTLSQIIDIYVSFTRKRIEQRGVSNLSQKTIMLNKKEDSLINDKKYKTRFCRDVEAGRTCPRGSRCTYAHSKVELRRLPSRKQQTVSHVIPISPSLKPTFSFSPSDHRFAPGSAATSQIIQHQSYCAPCDLEAVLPPAAPPNPINVVPVTPVAQSLNPHAVVINPRQPIALGSENSGMVSMSVPMVPVVVQQTTAVEPANPAIPVMPVVVQGGSGVSAVDAVPPAPAVPLGTISVPNGRVERAPEQISHPGALMMLATGSAISNAAPPQPVMVPTMWQVPPPQPVNNAAAMASQNSSQVIPVPLAVPPPRVSFDVNGVRWLPPCGQLLEDVNGRNFEMPVDCGERFWPIFEDGRCAIAVTPLPTTDARLFTLYNSQPSSQYCQFKNPDTEEEEQLKIRRNEIISRLAGFHQNGNGSLSCDETADDDDLQSHVSYTVANSVLYDDKEVAVVSTSVSSLELPPIPLKFNAVPSTDEAINRLSEVTAVSAVMLSVCSPCVYTTGTKPATVQAPCGAMQIKDTISQPLPTPAVQRSYNAQMMRQEVVDPSVIVDRLPPVIRSFPVTPVDPQNVVSSTLDRIVDVRERLNDVEKNGGSGCSAEKQQLKVELDIASLQIQSLDQQTKQTCLLRELEVVEKKMENLNVHQ